ncbi:hypothetical protein LptCag_1489 [Leptospirillum ferriphilum]|uniref:Uncharacterized protein n=1 Tax=Leptospirillum ferriphilum TaxID=178606 RepID=A0A094X5E9_9BACT|nr:hypothetical protein LptCag_1489 [Leptospirillum ferriphilum]
MRTLSRDQLRKGDSGGAGKSAGETEETNRIMIRFFRRERRTNQRWCFL